MALKGKTRFTYANVVSTAALVVAVGGGGAAVAATMLPANSVGPAQLKAHAVTNPKIANNAVNGAKIANGAVGNSKLGNGSVTANKFGAGTVGAVRGYAWNDTATRTLNTPVSLANGYSFNSSGGSVMLTETATGRYTVVFGGLNTQPATVLVNTYGGTNSASCHVTGWGGGSIGVECHSTSGSFVDSQFTIAVVR
ncbi:MAG TPA: hypothetical protein VN108_11595 [Marmoricola sp.]|nr:hypothetical protein [Marmoricola sp.]